MAFALQPAIERQTDDSHLLHIGRTVVGDHRLVSLPLSGFGFLDHLKLALLPIRDSGDYFHQLYLNPIQD
jgi:hypothetical protein